jgi:sugar phosphate isomerase/epimerase
MLKIGCKIDEPRIDGSLECFRRDLECFSRVGLFAVELPVHGLDAIRNGRLDMGRLRQVKQILRDYDFRYSVHSPDPINLMDRVDPEIHETVLKASLEFASGIGAGIVVYHPGRFVPEEAFPLNHNREMDEEEKTRLLSYEMERLKRVADQFPGITLCMENARPYLFHSPFCYAERPGPLKEQVLRINKENVRINLDVGHLFMASRFYEFDPVESVREIKELIGHTHIHDNFGRLVYYHEKIQTRQIPFGKGDSHMPVGWGEIPFAEIFSTFFDSYDGMFMMELRGRYFEHIGESRYNLETILRGISCKRRV